MKHLLTFLFLFSAYATFAQDSAVVVQDTSLVKPDTAPVLNNEVMSIAEIQDSVGAGAVSMPEKKKFKVEHVNILIGINYSFFSPVAMESDIYRGPYYPVKDSASVWTERNTKNNLEKTYKTGNIQFNLQANFWKGLFVGMNYQFFSVKKYKKDPNLGNLLSRTNTMFFMVSAQFGYVFEFLKNKTLQIHPSIRIGGYTADDYYDSGTGKKFYFGTDLQIRYLIKRKAGFSLGFDYDFLRYQKKGYSDIFKQDTYQKTTFSNIHINAGVYFNISVNTKK